MIFDTVFIDLDDTLYSHHDAHKVAMNQALDKLAFISGSNKEKLTHRYLEVSNNLKIELGQTASSHNRFIYFKKICQAESIPLNCITEINSYYWQTFLNEIKPYPGALRLLKRLRDCGTKVAVITDFQTEYQFKKIERLGILEYINDVITSEEVGVEKPNSKIYLSALWRMKTRPEKAIMIGDNLQKDIDGALKCGINSIWICKNSNDTPPDNCLTFADLSCVDTWFEEIIKATNELANLARYCGMRYDLTQAAGGNISVKVKDHMLIKSSGIHLADVNEDQGYSIINNSTLKSDINSQSIKELDCYAQFSSMRPSIETYLHSNLYRYTVHLHPLQINRILTAKGARLLLKDIWPDSDIIDYITPGIELSYKIKPNNSGEQVILLINHGVIFSTNLYDRMVPLIETTLDLFDKHFSSLNLEAHVIVNKLSSIIKQVTGKNNIIYLSEDKIIQQEFSRLSSFTHTFPDSVVYLGEAILFLNQLEPSEILKHFERHGMPKILIYKNNLYIAEHTLKKCRDVEAVIKSSLILNNNFIERESLTHDHVKFLNNWDAEVYRRAMNN